MDYNHIILIGRLTKDIESGFTTTGTEFAKCAIAVNSGYGDKKTVNFIDFTAWGKSAQFLSKNFSKGKPILIEGELKFETWQDKNGGGTRSKHTVNVSGIKFAGGDKKEVAENAQTETKPSDVDDTTIPF